MSRPIVNLPTPYVDKMKAVVSTATKAEFGINRQTWDLVIANGYASRDILTRLNAFFTEFGGAKSRLRALDFDELTSNAMPSASHASRSEIESIAVADLNRTGDTWTDIRALFLDRRNDEALALARWGLKATDFQRRLASAQSLIYLNQRLGRLPAAANAVDALKRIIADNPKLFSIEQRIRSAADITKCLSENGHPRRAAPLLDQLTKLCDRYSDLVPDQMASSVFRGACECKFLRGDYVGARTTLDRAMQLAEADTTLGTRLTHVNAVVLFSTDDQRDSRTPTFDRAWRALGESLNNLPLPPPNHLLSPDSAAPSQLPLATLNAVLITSALSGPKTALNTTSQLIDERAEWLFQAGLAGDKVLSCGVLSLPFAADILRLIPKGHPGLWIFESMVKSRLPDIYADRLSKSAAELLKAIS